MRKNWLLGALAASHMVLLPAAIAADEKAAVAADEKAEAPKEKQICRSTPVLGSRTRVNRVCMTKAEWDSVAATTKKNLDDAARRGGVPN